MYQFFGNNAMVRNISRVEAAPIYSTDRFALSVQPLRDTTARPCGLGGRGEGGRRAESHRGRSGRSGREGRKRTCMHVLTSDRTIG